VKQISLAAGFSQVLAGISEPKTVSTVLRMETVQTVNVLVMIRPATALMWGADEISSWCVLTGPTSHS
jgi:hypothetical protein